jgi:predicted regulator of Ras-like GTPase activity (Roadblock/LC7/MglB family)
VDTTGTRSAFFGAVDPEGPLEAVVVLRRTGKLVAAWTKHPAPIDILTVMGATGQASIGSIVEALGGTTPREIFVEAETFRVYLANMDDHLTLLLVAAAPLDPTYLRNQAQRLLRAIPASLPARRGTQGTEKKGSDDRIRIRAPP